MAMPSGRFVHLEGDKVQIINSVVERTVKLDDFVKTLSMTEPIATGILPRFCLEMHRRMNNGADDRLYVIQYLPDIRCLRYRGISTCEAKYNVALPFLQWYVMVVNGKCISIHLSCTAKPIENTSDPIFRVPLPNHMPGDRVCQGDVRPNADLPTHVQILDFIERIMNSQWNTDLSPNWRTLGLQKPEFAACHRAWQADYNEVHRILDQWCSEERRTTAALTKHWEELFTKHPDHGVKWLRDLEPLYGIGLMSKMTNENGLGVFKEFVKEAHPFQTYGEAIKHLLNLGR